VKQRTQFVLELEKGTYSLSELCRSFGISRPTGYKWWERYQQEQFEGLKDRSTAAHTHPNAVSPEIEAAIVESRRDFPHWGPKKLVALLARHHPARDWPSPSTVGDILKRHGLVAPRRRSRRVVPAAPPAGVRVAVRANDVWAVDFKGWWRTGDGMKCFPLTLSDTATRFVLRAQGLRQTDGQRVRPILEAAMREWGLPRAIRSDNGPPFASAGLGGLSTLAVWWLRLGIDPERIAPARPQQNGRHERMHLTLEKEVAANPAADLRRQQRQLDAWRLEFNELRPHEALGQQTPASFYGPSERRWPARLPEPEYPASYEVRRVSPRGWFRWFDERIFVGHALAGEDIGLRQENERWWSLWFCNKALSWFDGWECQLVGLGKCRPAGQPGENKKAVFPRQSTGLGKPPCAFPQFPSPDDDWEMEA
jgi:putative transposase